MDLHSIDYGIIFLYFAIVLFIGLRLINKQSSSEDFFLAGRKQKWAPIGFSLFASNISSTTLIGLCGAAYATGISISAYEWMATIVLVFFAIFFISYYIGTKIFTMPEFLEKRFNAKTRYYFSAQTIIGNVFIDTAGTLFAGALVINQFFPAVPFWQAAIILALVAGFYTAAGGLAAVIYTDVIQAVILIIGSTIITVIAFLKAGSWESIVASTPPEMLSLVRPMSDKTMPWLGMLIGVPILGFYFWCTNQFIVQRILSAKNIHHARWGAIFGGFLKLPVLFIMVLPGIFARQIFPDVAVPDSVFPKMVAELLPVGIKGLVLSGFVAAIMSSIDSTLHSASTLVSMDFIMKFKPNISKTKITFIGRLVTIVFMFISVAWVPVVANFSGLFAYLQTALAYLVPPVVSIFIIGLFWKKANGTAAFYSLLIGHISSISCLILQQFSWFPQLHFLLWAGVFSSISAISMFVISLITEAPSEENLKLTWSKERISRFTSDLPTITNWIYDYRVHSAVVLLLTMVLILMFW